MYFLCVCVAVLLCDSPRFIATTSLVLQSWLSHWSSDWTKSPAVFADNCHVI